MCLYSVCLDYLCAYYFIQYLNDSNATCTIIRTMKRSLECTSETLNKKIFGGRGDVDAALQRKNRNIGTRRPSQNLPNRQLTGYFLNNTTKLIMNEHLYQAHKEQNK